MTQSTASRSAYAWGQLHSAVHLITIRLSGIVPPARLEELRVWRDEQLALAPTDSQFATEYRNRIQQRFFTEYDYLLDENREHILLADSRLAAMIRRQLLAHCQTNYRLLAYCVMPNHVHAVLEVRGGSRGSQPAADGQEDLDFVAIRLDEEPDEQSPLVDFLRNFKRATATEAFALMDDGRELKWHDQSFDFWIRNESELEAVVDYLAQNPVEAGLVQSPEQWFFCSAHERFLHDAMTNGWMPSTTT
jgi:putative transposase